MTDSLKIEVLPDEQRKLFNHLAECNWISDFYLAGGTALALQLGHRQSIDFDFFTRESFGREEIKTHCSSLGSMELYSEDKNTLHVGVNGIRLSFFRYDIPLLEDRKVFKEITIASLLDIALMKLVAISGRGSKKDFFDLYFLLQIYSLSDLFKNFELKYDKESNNIYHLLKSLVYYEDAENQPSPLMLKTISWEDVRLFINNTVKNFDMNGL